MNKKIHYYGYEDGKKGLEASYMCDSAGRLFIRITGPDHWYDYFQNFLAWPREKLWLGLRVHRAWYRMAQNAPKAGNKKFMQWLERCSDFRLHYDAGDVVRFLPLFYSKYYFKKKYDHTNPFWKAHNNFPGWWNSFPDRVEVDK